MSWRFHACLTIAGALRRAQTPPKTAPFSRVSAYNPNDIQAAETICLVIAMAPTIILETVADGVDR